MSMIFCLGIHIYIYRYVVNHYFENGRYKYLVLTACYTHTRKRKFGLLNFVKLEFLEHLFT
jgi:hypothetical protein